MKNQVLLGIFPFLAALANASCQPVPHPETARALPSASPSEPSLKGAAPSALPSPEPEVKALTPPRPPGPVLAKLTRMSPQVTYRRRQELIWADAAPGAEFRRYDLVRTHASASARLDFVNGSELDLRENSLAIINFDRRPASSLARDRVVVRRGEVEGRTTREFWILTSAALLKMHSRHGKPASARLSIEEGKKIELTLQEGTGTLVRASPDGKVEAVALEPRKTVTFDAPLPEPTYGEREEKLVLLGERLAESRSVPSPAPAPSETPAELVLDEPRDRAESREAGLRVAGRSTQPGVTIVVNGIPRALSPDLRFTADVKLQPGANIVVVQMIRPDGTSVFQRRTVIRKD